MQLSSETIKQLSIPELLKISQRLDTGTQDMAAEAQDVVVEAIVAAKVKDKAGAMEQPKTRMSAKRGDSLPSQKLTNVSTSIT